MENRNLKPSQVYPSIFLWSMVFLFFFQLLTEFVEGIYLYGLLGTEIPPEIGMVVFLFAPFLWSFFRRNSSRTLIKILASIGFLARCVEIALPTRGRMIMSGIGLVGLLLYLPAILVVNHGKEEKVGFSRQAGMGLTIAITAHILLRAFHSGSDLSAHGMFRLISWGLAAAALLILWRAPYPEFSKREDRVPATSSRVIGHSLGFFGVLVLVYFLIEAPNVVARWAEVSPLSIFIVLLVSWLLAGWWWLNHKRIPKSILLSIGVVFVLAVVLAILPHQVDFPAENSGYPLPAPDISIVQIMPLYIMLITSPVLLWIFSYYLDEILAQQPSLRQLGGAFGIGGVFLLMMILSHVFTTVYDYIPVIGPFFRDKYWLVYLVSGLVAVSPLLFKSTVAWDSPELPEELKRSWLAAIASIAVLSIVGLLLITANPSPPEGEPASLRVFTYNIQQGYNDVGERNFDRQIALVLQTDPDIIGLQESDTARIAGGNADVVAYFANKLDMYSYYGPSPITGTFGIALLSKYPILDPHTHFLYSKGEQVAVIEADLLIAGMTYKVYVTHLGNGGPIFQMEQMLEIMRGQENVIAMGDFNFRPYEDQYAMTVAEYHDAFVQATEKVAPTTWGTDGDFEIEERIDHVFVSPGTPVLLAQYFTEPESDHPGLFVEIGLKGSSN
jgi:endonuclease/exonuclease/phosphatase family metal-dependent hydrolase